MLIASRCHLSDFEHLRDIAESACTSKARAMSETIGSESGSETAHSIWKGTRATKLPVETTSGHARSVREAEPATAFAGVAPQTWLTVFPNILVRTA